MGTRLHKVHFAASKNDWTACGIQSEFAEKTSPRSDEVDCKKCRQIMAVRKAQQARKGDPVLSGLERLRKEYAFQKNYKNLAVMSDAIKRIERLEEEKLTWGKPDPGVLGYNNVSAIQGKVPFNADSFVPEGYSMIRWNRLARVLMEQLSATREEIKPEARIIQDLGADSLDTVEVIMAIEEEFEIEIPDEDAENIKTVDQLYNYLKEKITAEKSQ